MLVMSRHGKEDVDLSASECDEHSVVMLGLTSESGHLRRLGSSVDSIALIVALSASTTSCCTSHSGLSPFTGWKPTHNP